MATRIPWAPRGNSFQANTEIPRLMMELGRQQAEGHLRGGENWARTIGDIGAGLAGHLAQGPQRRKMAQDEEDRAAGIAHQRAQTKALEAKGQRETAIGEALGGAGQPGFDINAKLQGLPPAARPEAMKLFQSFEKERMEGDKLREEADERKGYVIAKGARTAATLLDSPDEMTRKVGTTLVMDYFKQHYPEDLAQIEQTIQQNPQALKPLLQKLGQHPRLDKETLDNEKTQAEIKKLGAAPAPAKGPAVGSFEDFVVQKYGQRPTPQQITAARQEYAAADNKPGTGPSLTPNAESAVIQKLATQWTTASKPARVIDGQVKLMDAGMKAARAGNLAAGSQAVLVTFQKILDPESVVREAEFDRSAAGQSLINRAKGAIEKLAKGGTGIALSELENFASLAKEMAAAQNGAYLKGTKERLGKTADRYKIPRELVFEAVEEAPPADKKPAGTFKADDSYGYPEGTVIEGPDGEKVLRGGKWVKP